MSNAAVETTPACTHAPEIGCDNCDPPGKPGSVFGDVDGDYDAREIEAEVGATPDLTADSAVLVTLNSTPSHQPTTEETGRTGQWYAFPSRYVVDLHTDLGATKFEPAERRTTVFHGRWWDIEGARHFAASAPGPNDVREVPVYWYAPAFGRVDPTKTPAA
jgi:hypothetical protein